MKNTQEATMKFRYDVPFAMIDSKILISKYLTIYEKAIYGVLCAHASNNDKSCYPSYNTIAKEAGCSRPKAIETVASLENIGLIRKQEQKNSKGENTSNLYFISIYTDEAERNLKIRSGELPNSGKQELLPGKQKIPPSKCDLPRGKQDLPELYSLNNTHYNYNQSIYQLSTDRRTDIQNIIERLKTDIEYSYFEIHMPESIDAIDTFLIYIAELIIEDKPENSKLLSEIDSMAILSFLDYIKGKCYAGVKNTKAYFKQMFLECMREDKVLVATAK